MASSNKRVIGCCLGMALLMVLGIVVLIILMPIATNRVLKHRPQSVEEVDFSELTRVEDETRFIIQTSQSDLAEAPGINLVIATPRGARWWRSRPESQWKREGFIYLEAIQVRLRTDLDRSDPGPQVRFSAELEVFVGWQLLNDQPSVTVEINGISYQQNAGQTFLVDYRGSETGQVIQSTRHPDPAASKEELRNELITIFKEELDRKAGLQ